MKQGEGRGPQGAMARGILCALRPALCALIVFLAYGCATTAPPPKTPSTLRGLASWYGEEFAGRTTANGEIFDPARLTAAHRTLPFGTLLDITNPKTSQTVRVRVNDRGPYIGGRVIDLSYAAAQQISLIEPGVGEVEIKVVKLGSGEREPPVPLEVTIAESPKTAPLPSAGEPPAVPFPLPNQPATTPTPAQPVVVDRVTVETQRGDTVTRTQVAPDGRTFEEVPVSSAEAAATQPSASALDAKSLGTSRRAPKPTTPVKRFLVQVGAFSVEANANALLERLAAIGHRAFIERDDLFRVRIGPFATREQAVEARAALEANGLSAMIVSE